MVDRKTPPPIREIENLSLPEPTKHLLKNGIPVFVTNFGAQEVVKIEIIFTAGRPHEVNRLAARATAELLKEGSEKYDSAQIAELIDFYGGSFQSPVNLDTSNFVLYALNKHLDKLLPVIADLFRQPLFPQDELDRFIENNCRRLQLDLSKNDVVAYREITEMIFGSRHPYGYNSVPDTYRSLERADLIEHFKRNYVSGNCKVFVSGKVDQEVLDAIDQHLGNAIEVGPATPPVVHQVINVPQKRKVERPDTVQSAVRIGRKLFNRRHPDFPAMYVLNTILGGYFGSRLMTNIREDKGYTYNIYSSLDMMNADGYFYVSTEVGNDFVTATIQEIYLELEKLRETLISPEEIEMVRSFLMGHLLTQLDGAFNIAELIRSYTVKGVSLSSFEELVRTIKTIQPEALRDLARKYFQQKDLFELIVGP